MNDKFKKLDDFFRNFGFIPKWSKLEDLDSGIDGHDWEEMKKRGTVTETVQEKNGYKTITKRFVSNDGSESIMSSYTEFDGASESANTNVEDKIKLLQSKITKAIDAEDFETAAKLRDERQKLMDGTSK